MNLRVPLKTGEFVSTDAPRPTQLKKRRSKMRKMAFLKRAPNFSLKVQ